MYHIIQQINPRIYFYQDLLCQELQQNYTLKNRFLLKVKNTDKNRTFKIGVEKGITVTSYNNVGIKERYRSSHQKLDKDVLYQLTIPRAGCIIWTRKNTVACSICQYSIEKNTQAYGQIASSLSHLSKDSNPQRYTAQHFLKSLKKWNFCFW